MKPFLYLTMPIYMCNVYSEKNEETKKMHFANRD